MRKHIILRMFLDIKYNLYSKDKFYKFVVIWYDIFVLILFSQKKKDNFNFNKDGKMKSEKIIKTNHNHIVPKSEFDYC